MDDYPLGGAYLSLAYVGQRKTGIFKLGTLKIMTVAKSELFCVFLTLV